MSGTVLIDRFPESAERYRDDYAIVAIDVIRATTTAATAMAFGRRVFPARTSDEAVVLAERLARPLLVGELGGNMPVGFHITNSPAQIAARDDVDRPMVLVSSSGTQLTLSAVGSEGVYLACLRNYAAVARHIAGRHEHVAVLGAGTRGQFRREDQIGCALVTRELVRLGYVPENQETLEWMNRWCDQPVAALRTAIREGKSAEYLCKSGQEDDLEFVLGHIDDLQLVPRLIDFELIDVAALHDTRPRSSDVPARRESTTLT